MKEFQTLRVIKTDAGFIILKENIEELWLFPKEKMKFMQTWDLPYQLRDLFTEEENNAAE
ncbi:hypothetical protein UFOVP336_27 [uncultured Caudovirales phage]|uniref:Uncharacterized protein n=1 Tax=uncultured Caudovirales phage TaxID=2100421 RepID=A0A6J5LXH2_9CAUD|nr:hypothetical protein UFOVP336_27 [uncultured Caudovirales phage]